MDRDTVSAITHGDLPLANPLAPRDLDAAIAALKLPPGATAIDVGCGNGEVLARVKAAHHCTTMGIEPSERWAAQAHDRVDIVHTAPLEEVAPVEGAWDLAICIASSHAFGNWQDGLRGLRRLAKPGGVALVGEGFWRREPSASYLEALGGATADELPDHDGLLDGARAARLDRRRRARRLGRRLGDLRGGADRQRRAAPRGRRTRPSCAPGSTRARARWEHPDGRDTMGFSLLTLRAA